MELRVLKRSDMELKDIMKIKNTPAWVYYSNIYQINPRTFSPEGTFDAVTAEIPFLAELGFDIIYLSCVAEADASTDIAYWSERQKKSGTGNPKNSYRIANHFKIDSEYGTEDDLKRLVNTAHTNGIKVLFDLVYLHLGPGADILKTHPAFVIRDENGEIKKNKYNFPAFNFDNPAVREYLWSNMVYLITHFDVDGFRCDVGDYIPLDFWIEGKRRIGLIKPDALMINEGHDPERLETVFDITYGDKWMHGLYHLLAGQNSVRDLEQIWRDYNRTFGDKGIIIRSLDNHDTVTNWPERMETMAGHDGMELAIAVNYFIDGIPLVYCGNELADEAKLSMFANRFFRGQYQMTDRSAKDREYSLKRQSVIKQLNTLRKQETVLAYGSTEWISEGLPDSVLYFRRVCEDRAIVLIGNFGADTVSVPLTNASSDMKVLIQNKARIPDGNTVVLPKYGYVALKYR